MKKLSILVALVMVMTVAGVASANTIIVPFFNDGGSLSTAATNTGMRTYIRVKNLDPETILFAITYVDINGVNGTPGTNTFALGPLATVGFRPVADDTAAEGPVGSLVPNAVATGSFVKGTGGCSIDSANNIAGMVSEENWFVGGGSGLAPAVQ